MIVSIQILLILQTVCLIILWGSVAFWNHTKDITYAGTLFVLMIAYFASGGVTTCTFTLIMQLSQKVPRRHRSSHYTLLATSEVAGRLIAGSFTGVLTDGTSYVFTFGLLSIISMFILPFLMYIPPALIIET